MTNIVKILTLFMALGASHALADSPVESIQETTKQASKARKLPMSNVVVMFDMNGEAVAIADNPRWVIKGSLIDMWQNEEIHTLHELNRAEKLLPIDNVNLKTDKSFELTINPFKEKKVTVILDPFSDNSSQVVSIFKKYATEYQVRFLLTALSVEHYEKLKKASCTIVNGNDETVLNAIIKNALPQNSTTCKEDSLNKSIAFASFLKVQKSPTVIAPNDVYSIGMPGKLMSWLKDNSE